MRASFSTMLDPILRMRIRATIAHLYKVEPYVISADVYACGATVMLGAAAGPGTPAPPDGCCVSCSSRSSALRIEAGQLRMTPCCPEDWSSFESNLSPTATTLYRIEVHPAGADVPGSWVVTSMAILVRTPRRHHGR